VLHLNNGGEYTSTKFDSFCREAWIKRELTIPYNPQHNGVVKRENKPTIETVKSLIYYMDLPICLWVNDCNTILHIFNRCPHRVVKEKTL
jgi:transposase InsO family protein